MSHDEFQKYWLILTKKDAETDTYCKEVLDRVISIIDEKDYSHLYDMMCSYDKIVKRYDELMSGKKYKYGEHPFWCYVFGSTDLLMKDLTCEFKEN